MMQPSFQTGRCGHLRLSLRFFPSPGTLLVIEEIDNGSIRKSERNT